jgi:hypothetical protein
MAKLNIEHTVTSKTKVSNELFDMVKSVIETIYPSIEEENIAITKARISFKKELDCLLAKSYKIGMKIHAKQADKKDTTMYQISPEMPIPIITAQTTEAINM